MIDPNMVPALDPNPLPAPYWVFKLLLLVTFFLHIVAMNFLMGGAFVALAAKWFTKDKTQGFRVFFDVVKKLPSFLAATITLGIAPLLFVQVLYGQFFYSSSIVIAWPWFFVLIFITVAYYGFYYAAFRAGKTTGRPVLVQALSAALIFIVGFIYTNNFTLLEHPERWGGKYLAAPSGWNLNLTEPTLIPRYLHFFTAAIALGGLFLVFIAIANWKRDLEYARPVFRFGGKTFLYATMAQFLVGPIFLMTLPRDLRMLFMGDSPLASALLLVGILGGILAIVLMSGALRTENLRVAGYIVPAITAVVIGCMVVMRSMMRDVALKAWFQPSNFAVKTQWSVLLLFLALFVAGVVLWLVMLYRFGLFGGKKSQPSNP